MLFDNQFGYWAAFGTFALLLLTWQDYRNNMKVDDRRNYLMMGLSLSLISHMKISLFNLFALLILLAVMYWLMRKYHILGEGDINTISWIFFGLGLISFIHLIIFLLVFAVLTALYFFAKLVVFKYYYNTPFYGVILLTFVFTCVIMKLY